MSEPFRIAGPALISFSGGRTSAYMLHEVLAAFAGSLPSNVHVVFANTGKEREETLRFVYECSSRWAVPIRWVEWRDGRLGFEEVDFNRASRSGEPFEALIRKKQRLPNWQERWCTGFLKLNAMQAFASSIGLSLGDYAEVIGLRADEIDRVMENRSRADLTGRQVRYPLADAGVRKPEVMAFWRRQPFDLLLRPGEGNCDLCFLKGANLRRGLMRLRPPSSDWWARMESEQGGFFDRRTRYAALASEAANSPDFLIALDDEHDGECGARCAEAA